MSVGGRVSVHKGKKSFNTICLTWLFYISRVEDRGGGETERDIRQAGCHLFFCSFYLPLFLFLSVSVMQRVPLVQRMTNRGEGRSILVCRALEFDFTDAAV